MRSCSMAAAPQVPLPGTPALSGSWPKGACCKRCVASLWLRRMLLGQLMLIWHACEMVAALQVPAAAPAWHCLAPGYFYSILRHLKRCHAFGRAAALRKGSFCNCLASLRSGRLKCMPTCTGMCRGVQGVACTMGAAPRVPYGTVDSFGSSTWQQ